MTEVWNQIPGYEGYYESSNFGRIRSVDRIVDHAISKKLRRKSKIIKPYINPRNGYVYVSLSKEGVAKGKRLHRLVLMAFTPTDDPKLQCNHKNGIKTDNRIENLEWVTQSENMIHAFRTGLEKVTWNMKVIRLDDNKIYDSLTEAAKDNRSKNPGSICKVCIGYRSQYKGRRFAYYDDYVNNTIPEFKGSYKKTGDKYGKLNL